LRATAQRRGGRRGLGLRWQLFALVAGTLLPAIVFGTFVAFRLATEERRAVERRIQQAARALASELDREASASLRALSALAASERLDRGDLAGFRREATRANETQPSWIAVVLFTPDGRRVVDTREADTGTTRTLDPASFEPITRDRQPLVGGLVRMRDGRTWGVAVRHPVLRDGQLRYVVTALMSAEAIGLVAGEARLEEELSRTVVDRAGVVVARTQEPARFVGRMATRTFLERTRAAPQGIYRGTTLEEAQAYVAFAHAGISGWTAAVAVPAAAVEAPLRRSLAAVAAIGAALGLVSIGGALLLSRRFARAIDSAARAADALAHGGHPTVNAEGIAEVSRLGDALARSAELLDARGQEVEKQLGRAQAARAEAETASRAKDEFLAVLGHELRNPLSPIVTALELLALRGGAATREHEVIARQIQHLQRLVDDLLDVSRITRGKVELRRETCALPSVVARAVEMASPLLEQKQHLLTVDVPAELAVVGDPVRLAQVVANLLTNAARYTAPRGHVAVNAAPHDGGTIALCVTDDGEGIAPELKAHVFDPFVQAPQPPDRRGGGLGVGLAIVKNLVAMHGGRVEAESAGVGKGSTFRVILPAAPAEAAQRGAAVPAAPRARAGPVLRVLVVDDNVDSAQLLADLLVHDGHDVVIAHDGPSALGALDRFEPQVAILDIGLPVMDGYELATRIREKLGARAPAILGLSGYGQARDLERSRQAGFLRHFVKPADPAEVLAAVKASDGSERLAG
jgi:signal transduction histidine kinase/ActR/RegA family two-component response regulator